MSDIFALSGTGLLLTVFTFYIGCKIAQKVKSPLANPLLIAAILCWGVMKLFHISYENYMKGGQMVSAFLVPATAMIGLSVYRQKQILKEQFFPIVIGCLSGSAISMGTTIVLFHFLGVHGEMVSSLLPKSVTTAIALDLSEQLGGLKSITLLAVFVCGIGGAMLHPLVIKLLRLKDPVACGVAFGTASHAIGTAKALEIGELQGAVSGVSMGIAGICTVMIALFL